MKNAVFWNVALCRSSLKMEAIVPPKCRFTQDLHSATFQKTAFFIYCHVYDELHRIGLDVVVPCVFCLPFRNLFTPILGILVLVCYSFVIVHMYFS
jgi:hypothetical protein